jgi:hypothetical protein
VGRTPRSAPDPQVRPLAPREKPVGSQWGRRFRLPTAGLLVFAASLFADAPREIIDVFGAMAAALTDNNLPEFMGAFDKDMPGYGKLKTDVTALMTQANISSSIEPIKDEGDDTTHKVDLDWFLQVRSLIAAGPIVNRREVIHCELRKQGKHWKIVSLQPMEFFAPAKLDK